MLLEAGGLDISQARSEAVQAGRLPPRRRRWRNKRELVIRSNVSGVVHGSHRMTAESLHIDPVGHGTCAPISAKEELGILLMALADEIEANSVIVGQQITVSAGPGAFGTQL
jgi:hypothetical protein